MVRGRSLPRQPALTETIIGTDTRSISRQLRARSSGFASFTAPMALDTVIAWQCCSTTGRSISCTNSRLTRSASHACPDALFQHCNKELAYFKAPGWICFVDGLPTTGTQKIQKHDIFRDGTDPRTVPGVFDMRRFKQRTSKAVRD